MRLINNSQILNNVLCRNVSRNWKCQFTTPGTQVLQLMKRSVNNK